MKVAILSQGCQTMDFQGRDSPALCDCHTCRVSSPVCVIIGLAVIAQPHMLHLLSQSLPPLGG
jgi:hypothetical protein